jgi:DNA-binding XRE family transcriptional regulator/tetratricopeptide (TPR) repeat protein
MGWYEMAASDSDPRINDAAGALTKLSDRSVPSASAANLPPSAVLARTGSVVEASIKLLATQESWLSLGSQLAAYRKAAGFTQETFAPLTNYGRSTIANVERGRQRIGRSFWIRCDEELRTGGTLVDQYDRIAAEASRARMATAQKEQFRSVTTSPTRLPNTVGFRKSQTLFDDLDSLSMDTPTPTFVDWREVDRVRHITRALAMSENLSGGGFSGQAAAAQLRHSAKLVEVRASEDVRLAMYEAVGNLSGVVGFSAFDIANYQAARTCFEYELWCAEEGASWELRASALADMARLETYLGNDDEALSLIEFAQVRSDRLASTTRAMLSAIRARLLARRGRHKEALAEIAVADEHFANRSPSNDPPWISYYDEAEHQGSTARALAPAALQSRNLQLVTTRLEKAIELHDENHPRSRAFSRVRLASLTMKVGDPKEAASIGRIALEESSTLRSSRLRAEIEHLAHVAVAHEKVPLVASLRRDIIEIQASDSRSLQIGR